ncbi:universal stress protein [Klebsiella pneumoniae]|uniref:universal stress protein n=1 Tax=Klebsiella pneumoniae TaxID=573 RepID=UPI001D0F4299
MESGSVGETLAAHARNTRADLLVAGAYGHSRVREFILGGTTKELFGDPPCPLMMAF